MQQHPTECVCVDLCANSYVGLACFACQFLIGFTQSLFQFDLYLLIRKNIAEPNMTVPDFLVPDFLPDFLDCGSKMTVPDCSRNLLCVLGVLCGLFFIATTVFCHRGSTGVAARFLAAAAALSYLCTKSFSNSFLSFVSSCLASFS